MEQKIVEYTVKGSGFFPYDMLRYDASWPARSEDAGALDPSEHGTTREVTLRSSLNRCPTEGRWSSFGWCVQKVTQVAWLVILSAIMALPAFAGDREKHDRSHRREHHNYIIERQEAYEVQGTPSDRIIIGRREIDVYPDGSMYEGNALVGVKHDE